MRLKLMEVKNKMKNDNVTAEKFRKFLIETFYDGNAILGKNYVDWHTEDGKCGLTLMTTLGDYDIIITKKA